VRASTATGILTANEQERTNARTWRVMYVAVLGLSAFLALVALGTAPKPLALPLTMLVLTSGLVVARPVAGIYLIGFFALLTDGAVSPWYPFTKNMSSQESVLFVSNALILSPLEVVLGLTLVAFVLRLLLDRGSTRFVRGRLFWPSTAFLGFLLVGFAFGIATGGDRYVAIWEMRPILYLPILYVLVTNLFTSRVQYRRLAVVMIVALFIHSILALVVYSALSATQREALESLIGHASAIEMNVVILLVLAVFLLPGSPRAARVLVPLASTTIISAWLISQRRAAVVALAAAVLFLGLIMWKVNRRLLRRIAPFLVVLVVGYTGAFWNNEGIVGFPAQALKAVISPTEVGAKDQSSDGYRNVENLDIMATIHAKPITGLGFGQRFYRPYPLPDISFFAFYEYLPHNNVLWIWIKTGIGGFIALLFLFASAIRQGTRSVLRLPRGRDRLVAFGAVSYVMMYLVYAYVDVAWDARSMVCVAVAMALCADFRWLPEEPQVRVPARPVLTSLEPSARRLTVARAT
jgi:O-antigen ligase